MSSVLVVRNVTGEAVGEQPEVGLRERKKARLRRQIIDTSIKLFRKRGYEATRIDDIVQALEIRQRADPGLISSRCSCWILNSRFLR